MAAVNMRSHLGMSAMYKVFHSAGFALNIFWVLTPVSPVTPATECSEVTYEATMSQCLNIVPTTGGYCVVNGSSGCQSGRPARPLACLHALRDAVFKHKST